MKNGWAYAERCRRFVLILYLCLGLFYGAMGQPNERAWGLRSGGSLNWFRFSSGRFAASPRSGVEVGAFYSEEFYSTDFDMGAHFSLRQPAWAEAPIQSIMPQVGLHGRFRWYTSYRKNTAFQFGYQLNMHAGTGPYTLFTTGPELGILQKLNRRLALEAGFFFPIKQMGKYHWLEMQWGQTPQLVWRSEPYHLVACQVAVRYLVAGGVTKQRQRL